MKEWIESEEKEGPRAAIVIGMAGSGKTKLTEAICNYLKGKREVYFSVNLDPAVENIGYGTDEDIRDVIDYKEIMEKYGLGPNGAIVTSLNLYVAQCNQLIDGMEEFVDVQKGKDRLLIFDTPGQIEVFTWSAAGKIIKDVISAGKKAVIVYVLDSVECEKPETFIANMLYGCSVMYSMELPMVLAVNKSDIRKGEEIKKWLSDYEELQEAISKRTKGFQGTYVNSLCLVLEEFYKQLEVVEVSAIEGEGVKEIVEAIFKIRTKKEDRKTEDLARMIKDMEISEEVKNL